MTGETTHGVERVVRRPPRPAVPPYSANEVKLVPPPTRSELPLSLSPDRLDRAVLWVLAVTCTAVGLSSVVVGDHSVSTAGLFGVAAGTLCARWGLPRIYRMVGRSNKRILARRARYLRYIDEMKHELRDIAAAQRATAVRETPHVEQFGLTPEDRNRVWAVRPWHEDFGQVRLGTGPRALAVRLVPPRTPPVEELDRPCAEALRDLIRSHSVVPDLPVRIALTSFRTVSLHGNLDNCRAAVRAMVCWLAVTHGPDDLVIATTSTGAASGEWQWLRRLPHYRPDRCGTHRDNADCDCAFSTVESLVRGRAGWPEPENRQSSASFVVLVLEGEPAPDWLPDERVDGLVILSVADRDEATSSKAELAMRIHDDMTVGFDPGSHSPSIKCDGCTLNHATLVADALAENTT